MASERLFEFSDGSRVLVVERLTLGEIGIVSESPGGTRNSDGVILHRGDALDLVLALLRATGVESITVGSETSIGWS